MTFFDKDFRKTTADYGADKPVKVSNLPPIEHLDEDDLLALLDEVESRLPPAKLAHLNLEEELVRQLHRAKALQSEVLKDDETPANQKAQVMNTVGAVIADIVKMQERLYNAERFKALEGLLIDALKSLPKDQAEAFIDQYEKMGEEV